MSSVRLGFSQKDRAQFNVWLGSILVVFLLAVLEYVGMLGWLRAGLEVSLRPLLEVGANVVRTVKIPAEMVRVASRRYTYVLDLELRYAESAAQLSELNKLRQENSALRALLENEEASSAAKTSQRQRRIASILSYAQPTVSLGTADGIRANYLVFVSGTLVGRIAEVSEHEAQVRLLPAFGDADVLLAQTEVGVSGLLLGDGQEVLLKEIPIDASIQVGQRVETSGQVGVLPHLYLGRVGSIRREEGSPTQTAVIDQGISFYRTSIVEVSP